MITSTGKFRLINGEQIWRSVPGQLHVLKSNREGRTVSKPALDHVDGHQLIESIITKEIAGLIGKASKQLTVNHDGSAVGSSRHQGKEPLKEVDGDNRDSKVSRPYPTGRIHEISFGITRSNENCSDLQLVNKPNDYPCVVNSLGVMSNTGRHFCKTVSRSIRNWNMERKGKKEKEEKRLLLIINYLQFSAWKRGLIKRIRILKSKN